MNKVENNAILTADNYIKASNVIEFIKFNRGTDNQICFQGDQDGRFYVGVGSFKAFIDPQITSTGVLIYDVSADKRITILENYIRAAHLANLMNFILSEIKGVEYGSRESLFTNIPTESSSTIIRDERINRGFYGANGGSDHFYCNARGYADCVGDDVFSYYDNAVWW